MITAGVTLLALGTAGVIVATFMEWKQHARGWALIMKICPTIMAIGAICFGLAVK